ncbi:hypothetical protein [Flagellimonas myxillae]|uniref:hypothetical protein n=1 Tax=Flagellimonas myxillae TaxID=2942214 RepID=UPI00201FAE1F|nr:hypothetical protein [Muricauda myxillae]MCL6267445.1 hypothetical protein [Muricauda myxillae]
MYGVSFFNRDGTVETKEPKVPLSTISKNLRHEINPILQTIIQQAVKLDESLSTREIDLKNPLSVIIGSTVILDNFIQMITGVHEFHSSPALKSNKRIGLKYLIEHYFTLYTIIQEEGRAKNLSLVNNISDKHYINECSDFVEYILAIFIDNAWKYSEDNSRLNVNLKTVGEKKPKLIFTNVSKTIPSNINIFESGSKVNKDSKGFGYGLRWAKDLEANYNALVKGNDEFKINHVQVKSSSPGFSYQHFELENLKILSDEK